MNRYKHFCKIIYEDIEYELDDYFTPLNYKNKNYDKDILEIKLRGIRYALNPVQSLNKNYDFSLYVSWMFIITIIT